MTPNSQRASDSRQQPPNRTRIKVISMKMTRGSVQTHRFIPILLAVVAVAINIYLRLFPAYLPQLKKTASDIVTGRILNNATRIVDGQYADSSPVVREELVDDLFNEQLADKRRFNDLVEKEYRRLKSINQNEHGRTYLLSVDPYQWLRYTNCVVQNGYPGDKKIA